MACGLFLSVSRAISPRGHEFLPSPPRPQSLWASPRGDWRTRGKARKVLGRCRNKKTKGLWGLRGGRGRQRQGVSHSQTRGTREALWSIRSFTGARTSCLSRWGAQGLNSRLSLSHFKIPRRGQGDGVRSPTSGHTPDTQVQPLAWAPERSLRGDPGGRQRISSSSSSSSVDRRLGPCRMSASSSSSPGLSPSSSSSSSPSTLAGASESKGAGEGEGAGGSGEAGAPVPSSGRLQASVGGGGPPGFFRVEVVLRKLARGGRSCTPDLVCPSMAFCSWWGEGGDKSGKRKKMGVRGSRPERRADSHKEHRKEGCGVASKEAWGPGPPAEPGISSSSDKAPSFMTSGVLQPCPISALFFTAVARARAHTGTCDSCPEPSSQAPILWKMVGAAPSTHHLLPPHPASCLHMTNREGNVGDHPDVKPSPPHTLTYPVLLKRDMPPLPPPMPARP